MTPHEFVDMVARMNTATECPECLGPVDGTGHCRKCDAESDPTDVFDLPEVLDSLIRQAREVTPPIQKE
jgi:hypothetical protein